MQNANVLSALACLPLSYLVWWEVVQQLADVVTVLALPVVACPGDAFFPVARTVSHQALVDGLQDLQGLGARQLQSTLHELGVSVGREKSYS